MGKFVIQENDKGQFHFSLKAANGQIILSSQEYASKAGCDNGIESVRTNSSDDGKFERRVAKDGRPYFNLKAANAQVIGTSQMYSLATLAPRNQRKGMLERTVLSALRSYSTPGRTPAFCSAAR